MIQEQGETIQEQAPFYMTIDLLLLCSTFTRYHLPISTSIPVLPRRGRQGVPRHRGARHAGPQHASRRRPRAFSLRGCEKMDHLGGQGVRDLHVPQYHADFSGDLGLSLLRFWCGRVVGNPKILDSHVGQRWHERGTREGGMLVGDVVVVEGTVEQSCSPREGYCVRGHSTTWTSVQRPRVPSYTTTMSIRYRGRFVVCGRDNLVVSSRTSLRPK